MFSLLKGLWEYFFRKDEYFVVILGLDNAGKTTFLETIKRRYISNYHGMPLEKISTTVGLNVGRIDVGVQRLVLWDLGGQQDLQTLWNEYYAECHGVVYMIDSCDRHALQISAETFNRVIHHADLDGAPLLILANKQDREDALPLTEVESAFDTSVESIGNRDCRIQRVSALRGEGVFEGIEWLAQRVKEKPNRPLKPVKS
ncbi:PREDICTED: ADP-ribosylation factor-related protein 1-like [Amphimedon queenslandica]|uniref:ADP-ribosylation factor-like protein 6 n=1 Tax=Amphimedon queenslandica TaxID=400682 RepID=A0A1X7TX06_AMPQE|nr:PREDICTED: ADP-ribosylation factor-related protein 1-like [Amphimedon queenslandica]|eukprot:XP_003389585.1 PREDICTED: ADP-ribosylation factor-related protein 1-like [Amphimedon queenslandica]